MTRRRSTLQDQSPSPSGQFENLFFWSSLTVGIAVMLAHTLHIYPWMLDDAFISFRYSANFADGLGLVYNAGERVEGYTTFLWVFQLGIGKLIGFDIVSLARILAALCAASTIGLLAFSYRFIPHMSRPAAAAAVLMLCTCAVFTAWPSSGMEVNLFALLILLTVLVYSTELSGMSASTRMILAGILAAFATMTRPEGILLVAVVAAHSGYQMLRTRERAFWYFTGAMLISYGPYFVWRYSYYGYLLPNTFYAKVGSTVAQIQRGLTYSADLAVACLPFLVLSLIALVKYRKHQSTFFSISIAYVGLHLLYVIAVGGDVMPAFRFLTPLMALLAILAALGIQSIIRNKYALIGVTLVVGGFNVYQMAYSPKIEGHIQADKVAFNGREVGLWLKANVPPTTVLATNTAGSIPYYSELPIIDMLGLNDVHIAHREIDDMGSGLAGHEKGDGAYVLSRRPDIIQFGSSLGSVTPSFRSDHELAANQLFLEQYAPRKVHIPSLNQTAILFVRVSEAADQP